MATATQASADIRVGDDGLLKVPIEPNVREGDDARCAGKQMSKPGVGRAWD